MARRGILSVNIRDKAVLHASYLSFVPNGGLFVPTAKHYELGEDVFLLLNLLEESEKIPLAGKIIWITPPGAGNNRSPGIGIEFSENDSEMIRSKIETHLAGMLTSERPTHTL
ncbi:MAG TPA: pilus assembly protein PilZ [Gammaproteobacteria bacterium]|nr:pilus assembly protein PilZ [Gammaproteobacteria bacterium]